LKFTSADYMCNEFNFAGFQNKAFTNGLTNTCL